MPIKVKHGCGKAINAPDDLAGKTVRCPGCREPMKIPVPQGTQVVAPPVTVTCQACSKSFKAPGKFLGKTIKCPACQSPIKVAPSKAPKPPKDDEFDMDDAPDAVRECPRCNAKLEADDKLCVSCGTVLDSGLNLGNPERGEEEADLKENLLVYSMIGGALLIVGLVVYFFFFKS